MESTTRIGEKKIISSKRHEQCNSHDTRPYTENRHENKHCFSRSSTQNPLLGSKACVSYPKGLMHLKVGPSYVLVVGERHNWLKIYSEIYVK